jgi:hypothetical protein
MFNRFSPKEVTKIGLAKKYKIRGQGDEVARKKERLPFLRQPSRKNQNLF